MNLSIFNFLFGFSQNHFIANSALFLSYYFDYILIAFVLIYSFFTERKVINFLLFALAGGVSWIFANILKYIFHTARPFLEHNIIPLVYEHSYGFPSQHTAVFTSLAVAGYFINKKLGIFLGFCALFIGISRIVIGVHYPIDILGGAILGGFVGYLLVKIFKEI